MPAHHAPDIAGPQRPGAFEQREQERAEHDQGRLVRTEVQRTEGERHQQHCNREIGLAGGKVFQAEDSPHRTQILDTMLAIASELGASAGQVAIAWASMRGAVCVLGLRTAAQLADNLGALSIELSAEQRTRLDGASSPIAAAAMRDVAEAYTSPTRVVVGAHFRADTGKRPVSGHLDAAWLICRPHVLPMCTAQGDCAQRQ